MPAELLKKCGLEEMILDFANNLLVKMEKLEDNHDKLK